MAVEVYSVVPSSGHTGGGQLVTVNGSGFRVPAPPATGRVHGPWPADAQHPAPPAPTVRVLFGGEPATDVAVVSSGIVQCRTPVHDPSGIPHIDPTPTRAGQVAVPPSDVGVDNLDPEGVPVPGEGATLSQAYSFLRPDLTVPGVAARVLAALVLDLRRQVIAQVELNPHTDYDPTTGDFLNVTLPAALPALALLNLKMPQTEGRPRAEEEEVTVTTPSGYEVRRLAVIRDFVLTMLGLSDNQTELLGMHEALEVYFRRTGGVKVPVLPSDPSLGVRVFPAYRETDTTFTGRIGVSNVLAFNFTMRVVGVPFADMPGLEQDATAESTAFEFWGARYQSRQ